MATFKFQNYKKEEKTFEVQADSSTKAVTADPQQLVHLVTGLSVIDSKGVKCPLHLGQFTDSEGTNWILPDARLLQVPKKS